MKKLSAIFTALVTGAAFTGCSIGASIDTLMAPPKLSVEQERIYSALTLSTGTSISLKYPKAGKYLSAFIIEDIDGDGGNEAIVFYERKNSAADENPLRINVLDKEGDRWTSVYDTDADGSEIAEVIISKLGSDDRVNIIIGTNLINRAEKNFSIYNYSDRKLRKSDFSEQYSYMDVVDLNKDNEYEFVFIKSTPGILEQPLTLGAPDGDKYNIMLDGSFTDFDVDYGEIEGSRAMYIDAASGEELQTYIIYMNENKELQVALDTENDPVTEAGSDPAAGPERPLGCRSFDVDGDGCLEIPFEITAPGSENESDSDRLKLTIWKKPEGDVESNEGLKLEKRYTSYYSIAYGYIFIFPEEWDNKVSVWRDFVTDEMVFCPYDESGFGGELMRIYCAENIPSREDKLSDGYMLMHTKGDLSYLVYIPAGSYAEDDGLPITAGDAALALRFIE